jgi:hypothetical protein
MGDQNAAGGIAGTVIIVVILNVLSHIFNWGWVFY